MTFSGKEANEIFRAISELGFSAERDGKGLIEAMQKQHLKYTGPTPNPELDAARHDDDLEAINDMHETAAREAPGIVLKQLQAIKKPADWFNANLFASGNCAESILQGAFDDSNDAVSDAYAEFMIEALPYAKAKLLKAMADWFASVYAFEVYTEWLEDIQ